MKLFDISGLGLEPFSSADIAEIKANLESGVYRRFGALVNHRLAGFTANALVVWKTDDADALGERFAAFPFVSHCYRRKTAENWPYSLYAMVHARSEAELEANIRTLRDTAAGAECLTLKTVREYKKTSVTV